MLVTSSLNLYQYVGNSAAMLIDPSGMATKDVKGNDFGDWDIDQSFTMHQKPPLDYDYNAGTVIHWKPKAGCCSKIAFLQTLQIKDGAGANKNPEPNYIGRMTPTHWAVDVLAHRSSPFISETNAGQPDRLKLEYGRFPPPVNAFLRDRPQGSLYGVTWSYETCATCLEWLDRGKIYACLSWGFDVDATGKLTGHNPTSSDKASKDFGAALLKWNEQAVGPVAARNDPNQIPVPPIVLTRLQQWQQTGAVLPAR